MNEKLIFVICAARPTKRQFRLPCLLYLAVAVFSLRAGGRGELFLSVFLIIIYYCIRDRDKEENWIGRKEKLLALLSVPVLLAVIVVIGYTRGGESYTYTTLSDFLGDIAGQGGSVKIIYYQQIYKNRQIMQQNFVIAPIWHILFQNIIARKLFGIPNYSLNSVSSAYNARALSHTLSYIVMPEAYLHGRGMGSCFIAEFMQNFGWIGVIAISAFYGYFLQMFQKVNSKGLLTRIYLYFCLQGMLLAPRSSALGPFFEAFYLTSLVTVLGTLALAKLYLSLSNRRS